VRFDFDESSFTFCKLPGRVPVMTDRQGDT